MPGTRELQPLLEDNTLRALRERTGRSMSEYSLKERDFGSFFEVPFAQYGPNSPYVSPFRSDLQKMLDGSLNPVFDDPDAISYFTVTKGGTPVGRITAHIHRRSNERYDERRGCFGFFDCADDLNAGRLLLNAAAEWLLRRGCDHMVGNFNLTAMQEMGVVVGGHEHAPFVGHHYNPSWIPGLLEDSGFEAYFPMTTWRLGLDGFDPEQLVGPKQRELISSAEFTIEPIVRRRFRVAMEATWSLLNDSFEQNPLFVPLTEAEFKYQADQMLVVFDPRVSCLAKVGGEPVGVVVCLPDVNPLLRATRSRLQLSTPWHYMRFLRSRARASLIFGGVRRDHQDRGVAGITLRHAITGMQRAGYRELGVSWVSDSNGPSLRQMEKLGAEPRHRLNLFRKEL